VLRVIVSSSLVFLSGLFQDKHFAVTWIREKTDAATIMFLYFALRSRGVFPFAVEGATCANVCDRSVNRIRCRFRNGIPVPLLA
jgi:hypothetical protein